MRAILRRSKLGKQRVKLMAVCATYLKSIDEWCNYSNRNECGRVYQLLRSMTPGESTILDNDPEVSVTDSSPNVPHCSNQ